MTPQFASELFVWIVVAAIALALDFQLHQRAARAWNARGGEAASGEAEPPAAQATLDSAGRAESATQPAPAPAAKPAAPETGGDGAKAVSPPPAPAPPATSATAVAQVRAAPAPPAGPQPEAMPLVHPAAPAPPARVHISLELPPGTSIRFTVEAVSQTGAPAAQPVVTVSAPDDQPAPQIEAPAVSVLPAEAEPTAPAQPAEAQQPAEAGSVPESQAATFAEAPAEAIPGPASQPAPRPAPPEEAVLAVPVARPAIQAGQVIAAGRDRLTAAASRARDWLRAPTLSLESALFGSALVVYLATRLIGLQDFPIFFFTDEAVHTNLAAYFVKNGLVNLEGEFLPTYFPLGSMFGLNGVSVYLQVLPYLLFGKSVFVTRATSVLVTLIAAAAVGLILRDFLKARYWWVGTLLLSIAPTWFLHSRTAFENIEVASFYAGFLYFYLRYRHGSPRSLYAAVAFGALTFYTHGLGQVLMGVTGAALLLADLPYHLDPSRRDVVRRGVMLAVLLALPFVRFWLAHPSVIRDQLNTRGAAVADASVSVTEKLGQFGSEYAFGLSPVYWYAPVNGRDETRHAMAGYGNLLPITAPFGALGLLLALRNLRSPAHRILLLALLATPVGAALVEIGAPRILWFVIPATVLTGLGLSTSLEWLERRRVPYRALAAGVAAVLAGISVYMLRDSLVHGPTWFHDYTLYGMQYGARQVFGQATVEYLESDPQTTVSVSPSWANGADALVDFFLSDEQKQRVVLQGLDYYLAEKRDLDPNLIVVLPPPEYERAREAPLFARVDVDRVLPYPDGTPGFYFVRLTYSDRADSLIADARTAQHELAQGEVIIDGQTVQLGFTQLNGGRVEDIFDGDFETIARTFDINPAVFDFTFATPRPVEGVTVTTGSMDVGLAVRLYTADEPGGEPAAEYSRTYTDLPDDPTVDLTFDQPPPLVTRLYLEILKVGDSPTGTVHVREIVIR